MSDLTDFAENKLVDHLTGRTAYAKPAATYLALLTSVPTEGGVATEVAGSGYTRKAVNWSAASNGQSTNLDEIVFLPADAGYGIIRAYGVFDALAGGTMLFKKAVPEFSTFVEVPVVFPPGAVIMRMK